MMIETCKECGQVNLNQLTEFIHTIYRDIPENLLIQFWTYPEKESIFRPLSGIDRTFLETLLVLNEEGEQDIYIGAGLAARDYGKRSRCPANEIAGIVGLWADIDIQHAVHKKHNLPTTQTEAETLLAGLGRKRSAVIHSGHGLQAWWLFREPWIFTDETDRAKAASLAKRWIATLRAKAAIHGWTIDSVHDLARLMRPPGLLNWKGAR
jgi:hypothetical protein